MCLTCEARPMCFRVISPLFEHMFYVYPNIESVFVSNSFHSFHFIRVQCATHELFGICPREIAPLYTQNVCVPFQYKNN